MTSALACHVVSANIPISCKHITTLDGLSNNSVRSIAQDKNGFIWFGTNEGLNRWDGVSFTILKNDPFVTSTLSSNLVLYLLVDQRGFLWIATDDGLNRWDPSTDKITRFPSSADNSDKPGSNFILTIYEDSSGRIWIGSVNGLRMYSYETNEFKSFYHDENDSTSLSLSHINNVFEDHDNTIWIATHGKGLNRLNEDGESFTRIMPDENNPTPSIPWTPTCIYEDATGRYWVGTWDKGLLRFDPNSMTFEPVDKMKSVNIRFIREDNEGNLWVGTLGHGLFYLDSGGNKFSAYQHDPTVSSSLSSDRTFAFLQDNNDLFFIGTASGGVNTFRHPKHQIQHFQPNSIYETSLSDNTIMSLLEDSNGIIWIGTQDHGLDRYDPKTGQYTNYIYATEDNKPHIDSVVVNYVYSIGELDDGRLYLGTLGYGLVVFDPNTEQFHFLYDKTNIPYIGYFNTIKDAIKDQQGQLWVCNDQGNVVCLDADLNIKKVYGEEPDTFSYPRLTTLKFQDDQHLWIGAESQGLNLLNIETGEITQYKHDSGNPKSISDNTIWDIKLDHEGRLWIGTDSGLNLYHPDTGEFEVIQVLHQYPSWAILCIIEDQNGSLWLSTNYGLIQYNPTTNNTKLFGIHNGIQGYEYNPKCGFANQHGEIYFGGNYGYNVIDIEMLKDYPNQSPIVLSDIRIEGKESQLGSVFWQKDSIELTYPQNDLALHFVLLDYTDPSQNILEYKMDNSDEWISIDPTQEILFVDLPPGKRKLIIRGSNADGLTNALTKEFTINILPPFWMTWRFRITLAAGVCLLAYILYCRRVYQIAEHNRELQEKVNEQVAHLKILGGLLPICSYCKKVRDDSGYWSQVEAYIQEHSQAKFSHGICPDCVKVHFSEFSDSSKNDTPTSNNTVKD